MTLRFVLDASIAAKWYLTDERNVDIALRLLDQSLAGLTELHAPAVFPHEVCNLLAKACATRVGRAPRMSKGSALAAIQDLSMVPVLIHPSDVSDKQTAIDLSVSFSKRYYDMTYLALAQALDCQWLTEDAKIRTSCPRGFPLSRIAMLNEIVIA